MATDASMQESARALIVVPLSIDLLNKRRIMFKTPAVLVKWGHNTLAKQSKEKN